MDQLRPELMQLRFLLLISIVTVACSEGQAAGNAPVAAPGVVDSIFPPAEAAARFVRGLPATTALEGGASSADELVGEFFSALARSDSAAIARLLVSRAEYGFLYYPTSIYTRKPYELAPDIAWLLSSQTNAKAMRRLVRRLGGQEVRVAGWRCDKVEREDLNTIRSQCFVTLYEDGSHRVRQLFQSLIEREGRVKFLSYAGDL